MDGKISPSMMCADFIRLADTIHSLEQARVEYLHIDIMDGHFVPNFTLGPDFIQAVRGETKIPIDIHLMIERPEQHLDIFNIQPGDIVSVHQEATVHLQRTLQQIRAKGARASVALNPDTPLHSIVDVLDDLDLILIMTVHPGFAGQKLVPATIEKIKQTKDYLLQHGYPNIEIEVDGNVSFENARIMRRAGADVFVAGTSSIFKKNENLLDLTEKFREAISESSYNTE